MFDLPKAASHIASKHNNAREKKNNTKYAAWAAEQIARKYKVCSNYKDLLTLSDNESDNSKDIFGT